VLEALGDARAEQGAYSLAYSLGAIERTAQALRDRLSPAHARLLRQMGRDFDTLLQPPQDTPEAQSLDAKADRAMAALDHLAVHLAAATGAQTDRMTRDAGWRLLSVGRLIERLGAHVSIFKAFWMSNALVHSQGGDLLLELFDSAITFRARFQRRLERGPLLALLVMDEANPRALACVLRRLRTELGKLPSRGTATQDLLALLPHQGVGSSLQELCDPEHGDEAVLNMLNRLQEASWRLSDEVGRLYFAHAEPDDSTVST
jgi:uncharacterized alpha-E superfamily protein